MTPHEAVRLGETRPDLTMKERVKILALSLPEIHKTYVEIAISWEQCAMIIRAHGFGELPVFDQNLIDAIRKDPAAFAEYR